MPKKNKEKTSESVATVPEAKPSEPVTTVPEALKPEAPPAPLQEVIVEAPVPEVEQVEEVEDVEEIEEVEEKLIEQSKKKRGRPKKIASKVEESSSIPNKKSNNGWVIWAIIGIMAVGMIIFALPKLLARLKKKEVEKVPETDSTEVFENLDTELTEGAN